MISLVNKWLIVLLLMLTHNAWAAGNVDIQGIKVTAIAEHQYKVDGTVVFQLSETQQRALTHGVKLNASVDYTLGRHRVWWWNSAQLISRASYELKYHALSKHYVLKRLDKDQHWSFTNLPLALKQMGNIQGHVLPKLSSRISDGNHYLYVTARVGVESRSLPLKIQNYFKNSKYQAKSEGVLWALP